MHRYWLAALLLNSLTSLISRSTILLLYLLGQRYALDMDLLVRSGLLISQVRVSWGVYEQLVVPREVALLRIVLTFVLSIFSLIYLLAWNLDFGPLRSLNQK